MQSGYETTAAKKSMKVLITIQLPFKSLGRMTILFEDTVHPEAAMPFSNPQFNINHKTYKNGMHVSLLSVHKVAGCTVVLFINLISITD